MKNQNSNQKKLPPSNKELLMRYAGLAFQMLAGIGVALFAGYKIDQWVGIRFPLFMIIFSLLALAVLLWQIIKDTSKHDR
ncbi:putative F0F1-ATPase subunit (Ca2+/Mg2+ transporter) [Chitinophaga skermanii]|uniref:Putative F0F1-ATPase subunit (Ca2+/Mg2+ transporter) n=1 Tax=Chitinophaga skermanii TaxID=331697 RepID=A0A327Q6C5_9BACT|nr:AtpZ/AtpI family protein [Chitinophaga skermanii]RAI99433.1 putative F0F1-ATPase subunit (Ca2+/Mg2+ transporter) [Chitinophaga skermanii]